jgi:hypothetical protein
MNALKPSSPHARCLGSMTSYSEALVVIPRSRVSCEQRESRSINALSVRAGVLRVERDVRLQEFKRSLQDDVALCVLNDPLARLNPGARACDDIDPTCRFGIAPVRQR